MPRCSCSALHRMNLNNKKKARLHLYVTTLLGFYILYFLAINPRDSRLTFAREMRK